MLPVIPPTAKAAKKKKRSRPNAAAAKRKRPPTVAATVDAAPRNDNDETAVLQNHDAALAPNITGEAADSNMSTLAKNNDDVSNNNDGVVTATGEAAVEQHTQPVTTTTSVVAKTNGTMTTAAAASKKGPINSKKKKLIHPKIAKKIIQPKKKVIIANPILGATSQQHSTSAPPAPAAIPTIPTATADQLHPNNILTDNNAESDTLLLAAEAAAALIDNHATANDESTVNLLTQVDLAAAAMGGQQGLEMGQDAKGGGGLLLGERHDLDDTTMAAFESEFGTDDTAADSNNAENDDNVNSRKQSNFVTFTSRVPQNQPLSMEHTNFLSYYYSNESAGHNATVRGHGRKRDDDDEEELVVEDGEGGGGKKAGSGKAAAGTITTGAEGDAALKTAVTLKSFCSKFPKSKKNEKDTNKLGVKSEEDAEKELLHEAAPAAEAAAAVTTTAAPTVADNATTTATSTEGPQVEIINGEIVISQKSLLSHPETRTSTEQIDKEFGTVVEDDTPTQIGAINARYDSYITKPRARSKRWTADETKAFYRALRQCGTDFSMMQMFLEGRTRSQLKSKYKLESRKNGRLVDMALDPKSKLKLDLSVFGDGLEIPESVTPISRVSPSLVDGGGKVEEEDVVGEVVGGGEVATTAAAQGTTIMERNFDHLFDDEEDAGVKEDTTTAVLTAASNSEEVSRPAGAEVAHKNAPPPPAAAESIPLALAPTVKKTKSKRPRAKPKAKRAAASKK